MADKEGKMQRGFGGGGIASVNNELTNIYIFRFNKKEGYINKCLPRILCSCLLVQVELLPRPKHFGNNFVFREIAICYLL